MICFDRRQLLVLKLSSELMDSGDLVRPRKIRVPGQGVAYLAIYEKLHMADALEIRRQRFYQRGNRKFLDKYARLVAICERPI